MPADSVVNGSADRTTKTTTKVVATRVHQTTVRSINNAHTAKSLYSAIKWVIIVTITASSVRLILMVNGRMRWVEMKMRKIRGAGSLESLLRDG